MTSSGMYDYAGEWIYRVGIPAKSGVGGGILAALPARLGLGSYSPRLDSHGNSVRGIKVCEALSSHYDLHMLNRSDDARNSIIADYDIGKSASRRSRRPHEQKILAAHHHDVRIIELVGTLTFSKVDYISRQLAAKPRPQFIIFDLRRVAAITRAGARLIAEGFRELAEFDVTVILSGIKRASPEWNASPNGPAGFRPCATITYSTMRSNGPKIRWFIAITARSTHWKSPNSPNSPCWPG